ncbi:MAG: helix-turn-helix transcriptional regulator [Eubacteriaceae bacterium]|nr:helix-turn-helix transcriptional regulator [Eubacteriaceae bacterium]
MYSRLKAEIGSRRLTQTEIADALDITQQTVSRKLLGKNEFTLSECFAIKKMLKTNLSIDHLFNKE